jgi:hypothetical protein
MIGLFRIFLRQNKINIKGKFLVESLKWQAGLDSCFRGNDMRDYYLLITTYFPQIPLDRFLESFLKVCLSEEAEFFFGSGHV